MISIVGTPQGTERAGDEATDRRRRFEALFAGESDAILGYALRRVRDAEDAADVLADTFLVAWRRIDDVPPGREGRLWLYGVARRVLANHRRGEGRRRRLGEELRTTLGEHVDRGHGDGVDTALAVRQAMDLLDENDRELLQLVGWEGLTPTELAAVLGVPAVTVRTRLHRSRRRLRERLTAIGWEGERHPSPGHVESNGHSPVGDQEGS